MDFEKLYSIVGLVTSISAILFTAYTISKDNKSRRAAFWLEFRNMIAEHHEVHRKLRSGGDWDGSKGGPETVEDWTKVESYMGLFEHCNIMLEQRLIDAPTFKRIYSYRLENIAHNDVIRVEKLTKRREGWKDFLALLDRFGINYQY